MFNNKFSRLLPHPGYNVGGGIGEAALLGAAFGGAKGLVTGENILESALIGGATGAVTGGIFGGAGGSAASEVQNQVADTALNTTVEGLTNTAADQVANSSLNMMNPYAAEIGGANLTSALPQATQLTNQGITGLGGMQAIPQAAEQAVQTANAGLTGLNAPVGQGGLSVGNTGTVGNAGIASSGAPTSTMDFLSQPGVDLRNYTTPDTMLGKGLDWWADQGTAGRAMYAGLGGAAVGAMEPIPLPEEPEKQKSKLAGFDAQRFTPYMPEQPDPYYRAQYAAQGGVMNSYAQGGIAALAGDNGYPMGRQDNTQFATPSQMPTSSAVINADYEMKTDPYSGTPVGMADGGQVYYDSEKGQYYTTKQGLFNPVMGFNREREYIGANPAGAGSMDNFQVSQATPNVYQQEQYNPVQLAQAAANPAVQQQTLGGTQNYSLADSLPLLQATNPGIAAQFSAPAPEEKKAQGGIAGFNLGGYAAGGNPRLLKGPGDGMSDNIPATIGGRQPARLADGEFVVPADVVSHLGNGSTDAGAKHLYAMMDKVRKARTGSKKQGKQIKPAKYMPA
jgi:hypothetical protein